MAINDDKTIDRNIFATFKQFLQQFMPDESIHRYKSNFNPPASSYTALYIRAGEPISPHILGKVVNQSGPNVVGSMYMGSVLITCYGAGAFQKISVISHYLKDVTAQRVLVDGGIGYSMHSASSDDTVPIDNTTLEERRSISVMFHYNVANEELVPQDDIETVTFAPTYTIG